MSLDLFLFLLSKFSLCWKLEKTLLIFLLCCSDTEFVDNAGGDSSEDNDDAIKSDPDFQAKGWMNMDSLQC